MKVGGLCTHGSCEGKEVLYSLAIFQLTNLETVVLCVEPEDVISLLKKEDLHCEKVKVNCRGGMAL